MTSKIRFFALCLLCSVLVPLVVSSGGGKPRSLKRPITEPPYNAPRNIRNKDQGKDYGVGDDDPGSNRSGIDDIAVKLLRTYTECPEVRYNPSEPDPLNLDNNEMLDSISGHHKSSDNEFCDPQSLSSNIEKFIDAMDTEPTDGSNRGKSTEQALCDDPEWWAKIQILLATSGATCDGSPTTCEYEPKLPVGGLPSAESTNNGHEHLVRESDTYIFPNHPLSSGQPVDLVTVSPLTNANYSGGPAEVERSNVQSDAPDNPTSAEKSVSPTGNTEKEPFKNQINVRGNSCMVLTMEQHRDLFPELNPKIAKLPKKRAEIIDFITNFLEIVPFRTDSEWLYEISFDLERLTFSDRLSVNAKQPKKLDAQIGELKSLITKANGKYSELKENPISINVPDHRIILHASLLIALLNGINLAKGIPLWDGPFENEEEHMTNRFKALLVASLLTLCPRPKTVGTYPGIYKHMISELKRHLIEERSQIILQGSK